MNPISSATMDPTYSAEAEAYREKIQAFLAEHLPAGWNGIGALPKEEAEQFASDWRVVLHANRLLAASWPAEYGGGGLSELEQVILVEEFYKAGVPAGTGNDVFGIQMVGNTILQWGTDEQKAHFLPGSCRATISGARATPNPTPDPTWATWGARASSTATSGS